MTEYELRDLFISMQGEAQTTSALFLTVISGYLVVAYLLGRDLTKSQFRIFTGIFIVFAGAQIAGHFITMLTMGNIAAKSVTLGGSARPMMFWSVVYLVIHLAIAAACLKFMWDIRHPKTE